MKNAINWFAIPATDFNRAVKFYNDIFNFKMEIMKMGDHDLAFFPIDEGGVGGHISKASEDFKPSEKGLTIYLNGGDNLQEVLDRVEKAGGKISYPKTQITPEIGFMGMFIDSEGNRIALHSPK